MAVSVVARIPWKEIIKAVPLVDKSARKFHIIFRCRPSQTERASAEDQIGNFFPPKNLLACWADLGSS